MAIREAGLFIWAQVKICPKAFGAIDMQPDFKNWLWDHHREILAFCAGLFFGVLIGVNV